MEGRTIVRPDPALRQSRRRITEPSMEGRTIVRPDPVGVERPPGTHRPFNGGPDNRPARPVLYGHTWKLIGSFNGGPDNRPARPPETSTRAQPISPTFNGGPDNRPARPCEHLDAVHYRFFPSMEGRTIVRPDKEMVRLLFQQHKPSMEGRTIVRPDRVLYRHQRRAVQPSMEGRTIVRPDR